MAIIRKGEVGKYAKLAFEMCGEPPRTKSMNYAMQMCVSSAGKDHLTDDSARTDYFWYVRPHFSGVGERVRLRVRFLPEFRQLGGILDQI